MADVGSPGLWVGFIALVLFLLAMDLGVMQRRVTHIGLRQAAIWSAVWIAMALAFNFGVYQWFGSEKALQFLSGYVMEKALSVDNLFVFLVIFKYFGVPSQLQRRVLAWGILGALVLRALCIGVGAALLKKFDWMILVFGALLVYTGIKLLKSDEAQVDPESSAVVRLFKRYVPVCDGFRGEAFLVRQEGKLMATPLLVCLVTIEASDVVFAVDSIPAVFGITTDTFIVFTSNIFAILGLRALYFLLAGIMDLFHYLKVGLSLVLCFVGLKMLVHNWIHVSSLVSLGVIGSTLGLSILASVIFPPAPTPEPAVAAGPAEAGPPAGAPEG